MKMLLAARTSGRHAVTLILIATIAAAFTVALQQAARVLAAGLPQTITHS